MAQDVRCPDCGTELPTDGAAEGLCPQCLLSLAFHDLGPGGGLDAEAETLDRPSAGRILGERYQMRERLGQGGMGEVWRAFDLKLRLDVALKARPWPKRASTWTATRACGISTCASLDPCEWAGSRWA